MSDRSDLLNDADFRRLLRRLFSMLVAFAVTIGVSLADHSRRADLDRETYPAQLIRSEIGQPI